MDDIRWIQPPRGGERLLQVRFSDDPDKWHTVPTLMVSIDEYIETKEKGYSEIGYVIPTY